MKFYIVDTLSSVAVNRLPSCVVVIDENDSFPSDSILMDTVMELSYSDVVFIQKSAPSRLTSRYYSEQKQVPISLHSTIAAYTVLKEQQIVSSETTYIEDTGIITAKINVTEDFILVNYDKTVDGIKIPSEQISLKKSGDILKNILPGVITDTLPYIRTPIVDAKTLTFILADILSMEDDIQNSEIQEIINLNSDNALLSFIEEAMKYNSSLLRNIRRNSVSYGKNHTHHISDKGIGELIHMILDSEFNEDFFNEIAHNLYHENDTSIEEDEKNILLTSDAKMPSILKGGPDCKISSLPRAVRISDCDNVKICGSGTIVAEGHLFM